MGKHYHIITSCDDALIPYVTVQLMAMALNLKEADIDFYLFHSRVSRRNLEMLDTLCNALEDGKIRFHEIVVPHVEIYEELAAYGDGWVGEAYYSLCAHQLLPDSVERALYLDAGDTLILGDIASYYEDDFKGKSMIVTGVNYKCVNDTLEPLDAEDMWLYENGLSQALRGVFNSGSYVMNLHKMREDGRGLADYQYLSEVLRKAVGSDKSNVYWGDQGLLTAAFLGDLKYYGFPQIRDGSYMPYNFCLWYYNNNEKEPAYEPMILHFAGTKFKPWEAVYPVLPERFQKRGSRHSLKELKPGQAEYYIRWQEYAVRVDAMLVKLGF